MWAVSFLMAYAAAGMQPMAPPLLAAPQANPQSPASGPAPALDPAQILAFQSDPALRMTIPVLVGGVPHRFLVDTGAEHTGVSLELAHELALPPESTLTVTGFAGTSHVPTVRVPMLEFASGGARGLTALAFRRDDIGADGFLGLDVLAGKQVTFDFANMRMSVRKAPPGLRPTEVGPYGRADIRVEHDRLVLTSARVENQPVKALLDTGSSISVGNDALKQELIRRHKLGTAIPIRILSVTGEVIEGEYVVIKNIWVGDVLIRDMPVAFAGPEPFGQMGFEEKPALLLGMDALRVFDSVSIDFANHKVTFAKRFPADTYIRIIPS